MEFSRSLVFAVFVVILHVRSIQCLHVPEDPIFLIRGERSNLTHSERLNALTRCFESKGYTPDTIKGMQDLFEEVDGQTDGFYLIRAAEFIGDDYLRGKNCVCRGIYSSAELGTAKHCFSAQDEWDLMLDLCLARSSRSAARYLPKICGVSSFKELRHCCEGRKSESQNSLS